MQISELGRVVDSRATTTRLLGGNFHPLRKGHSNRLNEVILSAQTSQRLPAYSSKKNMLSGRRGILVYDPMSVQ